MNHVPARWLRILHICYVVADILLIGGIVALHYQHASSVLVNHWGATTLVAGVAGTHLAYGLLIYPWLQRKHNWLATVISQILFDLIFAAIIQASDYNNFYYRAAWIATVGVSTLLGFYMGLAESAVDAFLNVLALLGIAKPSSNGQIVEWLLTSGAAAAWLCGWYLWRRFYETTQESTQFEQLNRHLAQAQLQANIIIQSITDGVVVFDVSGKISATNRAGSALTGWSEKDAVGLDIHLVMKLAEENGHPLDTAQDVFMQALHTLQPVSRTLMLLGRENKQTTISLVISPIVVPPDNKLAGAVAVFRDVTQQRKEEQQRAEFISTASHEMRTPVAAIEGYLSLALNPKVSRIDSKAHEYLEKAHASTENLGRLFQDLLTSAKAEDGRLSSRPSVIEMGDYLQQLAEQLRFAAQKKNLSLNFAVGSSQVIDASNSGRQGGGERVMKPLYYVHADPDRLREVITNLFDNAVKYTPQGQITIGLTGDDSVVQLYVRDTGAGIPAEDIPHLFQKFYRVDNSATRTIGGTGLGLFISRKIVELYHGRIWVESKLGQGSTFYINLPRLTPQKAGELQTAEATAATSQPITPLASP